MTQSLAQRRARHAFQAVESANAKLEQTDWESYRREAKRLPVRIMTSGLGHALAFMHAKKVAKQLGASLSEWILTERRGIKDSSPKKLDDMLKAICDRDADFLRYATSEALQYLQWLVRFAEATDGKKSS